MGYLFPHDARTKKDIVAHVLRMALAERHHLAGNELWLLLPATDTHPRRICVCLLSQHDGLWGYKDIGESSHPYYYRCPLEFLALAPERNAQWRAHVRGYHTLKAARAKLTYGDTVRYGNEEYVLEEHLGRRGWNVRRKRDGLPMRMKARQFAEAEVQP